LGVLSVRASMSVWQALIGLASVRALGPVSNGATSIVCATGSPVFGDVAPVFGFEGVSDQAALIDGAPLSAKSL
jgi:hypothetical protein